VLVVELLEAADHLDHLRPADFKVLLRETAASGDRRGRPRRPQLVDRDGDVRACIDVDLDVESAGRSLLAGVDAATNW